MERENQTKQKSIQDIRDEVLKKIDHIRDRISREYEIEWRTFCRIDSQQLTTAFLTDLLRVQAAYYREEAMKEMITGGGGNTFYYRQWDEIDDALSGATGKGPVAKTIDYFRKEAIGWREAADRNREMLEGRRPLYIPQNEDFLQGTNLAERQVVSWDRVADNLETAARLFENRINFQVDDTEG